MHLSENRRHDLGIPTTLRFCKTCQKVTPHQIRAAGASVTRTCVPCLDATLHYELDRD